MEKAVTSDPLATKKPLQGRFIVSVEFGTPWARGTSALQSPRIHAAERLIQATHMCRERSWKMSGLFEPINDN